MTTVEEVREQALSRAPSRGGIARAIRLIMLATSALDAAVLVLAVALAAALRTAGDFWGRTQSVNDLAHPGVYLVLGWLLVLTLRGGYSPRHFGAGPAEFRTVGMASFVTAGLVGLVCYLFQVPLSRAFVFYSFLLGTPLLLVERYAVRAVAHALRRRGHLMHRVVAVGGPSGISEVVDALRRSRAVGYEVVGACVPEALDVDARHYPVPVLGRVADVRSVCEVVGADSVLVARGGYATSRELRSIGWSLEGSDLDLVVVPSLTDVAGPRIHMRPVAGLPLLHVEPPQVDEATGLSKRAFDLVMSSVGLLVLAPVLLVVAAVVKVQDGGPVFFHQARVGRDGRPFLMTKFRSMVPDAEVRLAHLREQNESDGVLFKIREDPRITSVGRFLRRYSLDELPQLLNVLRGDMSLVGPRPPLPSEVDLYAADVHRRLLVRPGLTGLWQVSGRSELSWDESVRLDLFYVDNWSMTTDMVIIAKTVRAVVGSSGAY